MVEQLLDEWHQLTELIIEKTSSLKELKNEKKEIENRLIEFLQQNPTVNEDGLDIGGNKKLVLAHKLQIEKEPKKKKRRKN